MAVTVNNFIGGETGGTEETVFSPSSTSPITGTYSYTNVGTFPAFVIADAGSGMVVGFKTVTPSSIGAATCFTIRDSSTAIVLTIQTNASGKLLVVDSTSTTRITGSTTLSTSTEYQVEVYFTRTGTNDTAELFLDNSSEGSDSSGDYNTGTAIADAQKGGGFDKVDDVYFLSGCTAATDRLDQGSGVEVLGAYQVAGTGFTSTGTPDNSTTWPNTGETPGNDTNELECSTNNSTLTGTCDGTTRPGPGSAGSPPGGTIKAAKWIIRAYRSNGSNSTPEYGYGNSTDGLTWSGDVLGTSAATFEHISEGTNVPTSSEDFQFGLRKGSGGRNGFMTEAWGMLLHVPPAPFTPNVSRYRFYEDDGSESASTPIAAEDTNITRYSNTALNEDTFHLRIQVQETAGTSGASTDDWKLQYNKNSGTWTDVTGASSNVRAVASANLTDGGTTTNRSTDGISDPGTGSFVAGEQEEVNGVIEDRQLTADNFTEHVFALQLQDADLADNDTIDFRLQQNNSGSYVTVTQTPTNIRVTVDKGFGPKVIAWRFYEDDDVETASTPVAAQDTDITRRSIPSSGEHRFHLRFQVQEQNGVSGASTDDYDIQVSKNGGSYLVLQTEGFGSNIEITDSTHISAGGPATTNRSTDGITDPGTGSFVAGEQVDDSNQATNRQLTASNFTEHLYSLRLDHADLSNGDTLDLRLRQNNSGSMRAIAIDDIPRITVEQVFEPHVFGFRFYEDDGDQAGSTAIDAENTNITRDDTNSAERPFHLRYLVNDQGGVNGLTTDDYQIQVSKNSGAWSTVNSASSNVQSAITSALVQGTNTTDRATGITNPSSGTFLTGQSQETQSVFQNHQITAGNFTEHVAAMVLVDADLADTDTLDFRLTLNGGTPGMTQDVTPRITISVEGGVTRQPPQATLTITNKTPVVTRQLVVRPPQATLTITNKTPDVSVDFNVEVPQATLTLSTFAPTVVVDHVRRPPKADLTLSTFTPDVTVQRVARPQKADLTLSTFIPDVSQGITREPPQATLTITNKTPDVTVQRVARPPKADLTLSTFTPTVTRQLVVRPPKADLTLSTFTPTVAKGLTRQPPKADLTLTNKTPTVTRQLDVRPPKADLTISTFTPTVTKQLVVRPPKADLTITAFTPTVASGVTRQPPKADLTITAKTPEVTRQLDVRPPKADLTITNKTPTVTRQLDVRPTQATLTITNKTPVVFSGVTRQPPKADLTITAKTPVVTRQLVARPPKADLTITAKTPTVVKSGALTREPPQATLTITNKTPVVTRQLVVRPPQATLTITNKTPVVFAGVTRQPPKADLTITAKTPTVTRQLDVRPPKANLTISTFVPTVATQEASFTRRPPKADLTITGKTPTVTRQLDVRPPKADLTISTFTPTVDTSDALTRRPPKADLTITGKTPDVTRQIVVRPPKADLTITNKTPTAIIGYIRQPPKADLTITQKTPTVILDHIRRPPKADLTISAKTPAVTVQRFIEIPQATLTFTNKTPTVRVDANILENGFQATAALGDEFVKLDYTVSVTGFVADATLGDPTFISQFQAIIPVTGFEATGDVGDVRAQEPIVFVQGLQATAKITPPWIVAEHDNGGIWTEVPTGGADIWTEVSKT